ncbi:ABC transporter permease [Isoptericola sp. b441]|uniref:ABC transporter permease n=1 Tax=Actinotalea lenta TaxID=3064654 RepID=A0ABT9D6Q3_9CELL|nr:ABC transporter permease [Isoptericola sp. b441]MDO8106518.1 ABC transporter permease [Isoptericola sp. b441]
MSVELATSTSVSESRDWVALAKIALSRSALWLLLVALAVVANVLSHGSFLTLKNVVNILAQNSVLGVLAVGQTLVILTAGIDLSLGSITALVAIVVLQAQGLGFGLSLLAGLLVGLIAGLVNGLLVSVGRVPPFIATLGMMQVAMGLAYVLSQGFSINDNQHVGLLFGHDKLFGLVPSLVIVWAVVTVVAWFVTKRMRYGSYIYAVGGSPKTARTSGVPVTKTLVFAYAFAGVCAAIGAVLYVNRNGNAEPSIANITTLSMSMAPVVVGGTSLFGGIGGVWKTISGVLVLGVLGNIMVLVGVPANPQQAIQGVIMIAVVFIFVAQERRQRLR